MDLRDFFRAVARAWWVLVLTLAVTAGGMYLFSSTRTPLYQSSAQVFVTLAKSRGGTDLSQGVTFVQAQVASYAQLVTSPIVLDPVATKLGVPGGGSALKGQVSSSSSKETVIISIVATDPSAPRAAQITEALAAQLGVAIRELAPRNTENEPSVQTVVISRSAIPTSPSSPKVMRDTAAAAFAGLVLGGLLAGGVGLLLQKGSRTARRESRPVRRAPGASAGSPPPTGPMSTMSPMAPTSAMSQADRPDSPLRAGAPGASSGYQTLPSALSSSTGSIGTPSGSASPGSAGGPYGSPPPGSDLEQRPETLTR